MKHILITLSFLLLGSTLFSQRFVCEEREKLIQTDYWPKEFGIDEKRINVMCSSSFFTKITKISSIFPKDSQFHTNYKIKEWKIVLLFSKGTHTLSGVGPVFKDDEFKTALETYRHIRFQFQITIVDNSGKAERLKALSFTTKE